MRPHEWPGFLLRAGQEGTHPHGRASGHGGGFPSEHCGKCGQPADPQNRYRRCGDQMLFRCKPCGIEFTKPWRCKRLKSCFGCARAFQYGVVDAISTSTSEMLGDDFRFYSITLTVHWDGKSRGDFSRRLLKAASTFCRSPVKTDVPTPARKRRKGKIPPGCSVAFVATTKSFLRHSRSEGKQRPWPKRRPNTQRPAF